MWFEELHVNNIIHTDLKPSNCLVKDGVAKISDLDCVIAPSGYIQYALYTTPGYRAPELYDNINKPSFSNKIDIWSLGHILYKLYTRRPLFKGMNDDFGFDGPEYYESIDYQQRSINYKKTKGIPEMPEDVQDLLWNMLVIDPKDRYDISQVLNHKVFQNFNCEVNNKLFYQIQKLGNNIFDESEEEKIRTIFEWIEHYCIILYKIDTVHFNDVRFTAIDMFLRVIPKLPENYKKWWLSIAISCMSIAAKLIDVHFSYYKLDLPRKLVETLYSSEVLIMKTLNCEFYHIFFYNLYPKRAGCWYGYLMNHFGVLNEVKLNDEIAKCNVWCDEPCDS